MTYNPISGPLLPNLRPPPQVAFNPIIGGGVDAHRSCLPQIQKSDLSLLKDNSNLRKDTFGGGGGNQTNHVQRLGASTRNPILQEADSPFRPCIMRVRSEDQVGGLLHPPPPHARSLPSISENSDRKFVSTLMFGCKSKMEAKYSALYSDAFDASRESRNAAAQHQMREKTSNEVFFTR